MSIQAVRKTGFLVEDGVLWGRVIGYLRYSTDPTGLALANVLDVIRAQNFYEPIQTSLIVEEIQEVA